MAPRGIAFSTDRQYLYVADPGASTGGQIFQLAPGGLHAFLSLQQQGSVEGPQSASFAESLLLAPQQEKPDKFAWADSKGGGNGKVYLITL